jgi:molybdenum cofactor cytidylyltransferase
VSGPIVGILLAAGRGSRFGSDKLLHRLPDGTPMAVAAAVNFRPACDRLVAVIRPEHDSLGVLLAETGCEIVPCSEADGGMGHSLAAGVRATAGAAGWIVALADMPFIASSSHQTIADCLRTGASLAASQYQGRRGHPVGFARQWFPQLVAMTGDQGGKAILGKHPQDLVLCPVDDAGVIRDIDRPEDLAPGRS